MSGDPPPRALWRRVAALVAVAAVAGAGVLVAAQVRDDRPSTAARGPAGPEPSGPPPVLLSALPGGFEGAEVTSAGWSVKATQVARAAITTRVVHSGRGALGLDTSRAADQVRVGSPSQRAVPGQEYGASGFVLVTTGRPLLHLEFLDTRGRAIATETADSTEPDGIWSRTSVQAAAPTGATDVRVVVSAARSSAVVWDDIDLWTTALPDPGFEVADGASRSPRSWRVSASPGTSASRVTAQSHSGRASLELHDSSTTGGALAASPLVPVPQGAELEVRGWARSTEGETSLRVRWFDAERHLLSTGATNGVRASKPEWTELAYLDPVPDAAAYAQLQIATSRDGVAASAWDDLSLRPTGAQPERSWETSAVATMKGFANTKTSLVSSVDGVPKFSTVASGSPAVFQFADLATGTVEYSHEIPGILNGWALTPSLDQRVVFIGGEGHVWRFDTKTKTLRDLGRASPRATRVFDLVTAPDGRIWGGSYPHGDVWVLDPVTERFTSAGSVGNGNAYARTLAVDAKFVYVGTGSVRPDIVQISTADPRQRSQITPPASVRTGFLTQLKVHAGFLTVLFPDSSRGVYDTTARRWVDASGLAGSGNLYQLRPGSTPPDGRVHYFRDGVLWGATVGADGVRAQPLARIPAPISVNATVVRMRLGGGAPADWLVAHDGHTRVVAVPLDPRSPARGAALPSVRPRELTIRLRPTALRVKSLDARGDQVVVGGYGGASLSVLDTRALGPGSPGLEQVVGGASTPKNFGEVEGMVTNGRYQYFGTYPRSRIFRLDTTQPWKDRTNPRMVVDLGATSDQDRPIAWATSGSRTFFGTIPDYGVRGGVLGWFDGGSTTPVVVDPPVPDQSVVALTTDRSVVFGSTSRWGGLGAPPSAGPPSVFSYDADRRRLLWTVTPDRAAQSVGSVLHDDRGRLWAVTRNRVFQLDPATGQTIRTVSLGIPGDPTGGDPDDGNPAAATFVSTAMVSLGGHIYVATGGRLLELDPGTSRIRRLADEGVTPSRLAVVGDDLYFPATTVLMRARPR